MPFNNTPGTSLADSFSNFFTDKISKLANWQLQKIFENIDMYI